MRSGNLVSGPGFAFIINGGLSLIGGADYKSSARMHPAAPAETSSFPHVTQRPCAKCALATPARKPQF